MRTLPIVTCFIAVVFATAAADISKNPSISLAGEKLFLANVEGGGSDVLLNEYIRTNETFDNWKILFAVRRVQTTNGVSEVVARWKAYLAQVDSPGMKLKEEDGSSAKDRRFMLAIRPPGDAYLETDQMRFVPGPDGKSVIYYQASIRVNPKNETEVKEGLVRQIEFAKALKSISVTPIEKMPDPKAESPNLKK